MNHSNTGVGTFTNQNRTTMQALFYKGEDITLSFNSAASLAGYTTKTVKFFTPMQAAKTAVVTVLDTYNFTAKLGKADTAALTPGRMNIVVELSDGTNTIISKTIQCKLADAYLDGAEREAVDVTADIVFTAANQMTVNFVNTTPIIAETAAREAADAQIIADIKAVAPASAFNKRMAAIGGTVDKQALLKLYMETIQRLSSTQVLYIPQCGLVERTSGVNKYASLVGDMSANNNDATQATEATQPFIGGYIAPSEMRCLKFTQGQTQTGQMVFAAAKSFLSTDSWTLRLRVKVNSRGRIYLNTTTSIIIGAGGTVFDVGGSQRLSTASVLQVGKTSTVEFQYSGGVGLIKIDNIPVATSTVSGPETFGYISYNSTYPFDVNLYSFHLSNTRASEAESSQAHAFLSAMFPEVESVAIGNQVWSTDNFCGTVAGDGTVVNEVQLATNTAILSGETFDTPSNYTTSGESVVGSGVARIYSSAGAASTIVHNTLVRTVGKMYKYTFTIIGTSSGTAAIGGQTEASIVEGLTGVQTFYVKAAETAVQFKRVSTCDLTIDNLTIEECGAADSTNIYNSVYAATTGTAAVKDLAATKAAAMWCHYDNLAANGAVYGKLYNWYAVHLFDLYPPVKGWRVPSSLDFSQLSTYLGGDTVSGGRMKVTGTTYWQIPNFGATNECGLSLVPSGRRSSTDGTYGLVAQLSYLWTGTPVSAANARFFYVAYNSPALVGSTGGNEKGTFVSLRLLRNEPAGQDLLVVPSSIITGDIASSYNDTVIPCGYRVREVRAESMLALTGFKCEMYDYANTTKQGDMITSETIPAGIPTNYPVASFKCPSPLVDRHVRTTATGNAGGILRLFFVCEKVFKSIQS